ncbi:serine hydrolase [Galbibacter sp. EGI 63066]|uniref:serine hydrolase domain-containing protein n=1 Tax=Galbibacter sp. EGI 63066 TaxID=2993559 RepID=UPI0022487F07|nr:serine hydrolase domain-containing protein [Galbibacter sp. EGI 63066]MCX2678951.1 serine hydrolase [Galbibacter sp. EGI 63066]
MKSPKQLLKIIILTVVLICAVVFIPWDMARAWLAPLPDTIQEQLDNAIDYNLDGIIVYVDQSGKPPELYTAGWKDKENKVPADPQALFKIGSISKLYIAAAAAKLITSKNLSLDRNLADYLPELAGRVENADQISLRMLLQHRSGIPDWIEDPEFPWDKSLTDVNKVLELVLDDPSEFEPDSRYDYSNTNYLLIGKILDKTLGYNHQQYIRSEILTPLGLTHTFGLLSEVDSSKVVSGYDSHYDKDVKMLDFVSPGGSMVATVQDVGIFLRALNDGSLLNKEEQTIYSSIYKYGHTGLLPGYQSIARYHKNTDTVVIQFVNTSGGNAWTISEIVYNRIIKILSR